MKFYKFFTYILFIFLSLHKLTAQTVSNEGAEFWLCFPAHASALDRTNTPLLATMSLFITSKYNSEGKVRCGDWETDFKVQASRVTEILVPRDVSYLDNGNGISTGKGINIRVTDGSPGVVAYAHVFAGSRSAATLALPVAALGRKYYAIAFTQQPGATGQHFSQLNIVAVDEATTVKITAPGKAPFNVVLENAGDVYQYQSIEDVSGTLIEADPLQSPCKKIAVFSGSSAVSIKQTDCNLGINDTYDPLLQQLYPLESWGKSYALIPFYGRTSGSIYRVLAAEDNTQVNIFGKAVVLNAGEFYTTEPIYQVSELVSNKSVMLSQYALTQNCADPANQTQPGNVVGDPDMVVLNPVDYGIREVTLYSSSKLAITEQYINVAMPASRVSSFFINGINQSANFRTIPGSKELAYAQIDLRKIGGSNFNLSADTIFNATAYGFGPIESYAYSAGTNLAASVSAQALKQGTNIGVRKACLSEAFDFQVILPYQAKKLSWKLEASSEETVIQNPIVYDIRMESGKASYEYRLFSRKSFSEAGNKHGLVKVIPENSQNNCYQGTEEIVRFDLAIEELPKPMFSMVEKSCVGSPVLISYRDGNEQHAQDWSWDFGDGNFSSQKDPEHTYLIAGVYRVKLSVRGRNGCFSDTMQEEIEVTAVPEVAIQVKSLTCQGEIIQFLGKGNVTKDGGELWTWDFGDHTASVSGSTIVYHTYVNSGTYTVKLTVSNTTGCVNITEKQIVVKDPVVIDFADPASCIDDVVDFVAEIVSGSVISWEWDFGDGIMDVLEKAKANAKHKFLLAGNYNVTLKAISSDGCNSTITKTVTINGANPNVSFEVLNQNNLCSYNEVLFKNTSTIGLGKITKLEWLLNFDDNQTVTMVDNQPELNKIYSYSYPALANKKNYQVVLRAYSGAVCFSQSPPRNITINAGPTLSFDNVSPVCLNADPFLLRAGEANGIAGTFKFSGKGISGVNTFNPGLAGVGDHEISYMFLTANGCTSTLKRTIKVNPLPELGLAEHIDILLGGEHQVAFNTFDELGYTFKWTPATGLSADNILNPIASPKETTKYILSASTPDGCTITRELLVKVHIDPTIPNAFSPNGDGINDTWSIKFLETFVNADIKIFNRYGQEVFHAKRYTDSWDGRYNNADVPVGVYYYIIEPNNGRSKYTGSITLVK